MLTTIFTTFASDVSLFPLHMPLVTESWPVQINNLVLLMTVHFVNMESVQPEGNAATRIWSFKSSYTMRSRYYQSEMRDTAAGALRSWLADVT